MQERDLNDVEELDKSRYLKGDDVGEEGKVLKIARATALEFENGDVKAVLHFQGDSKPMILNKTNRKRLAKMFESTKVSDWTNKAVCVFFDRMVEYKGEIVGGLRVKPLSREQAEQVFDDKIPF